MTLDPKQFIDPVIQLATQAGEAILKIYETDFDISEKQDNTPLTAADMAAHDVIVHGLEKLTPNIPILSEESASIPFEERSNWDTYWLVDPLDGTREFIKRNGEFTVNIALIDQHKSIMGVIYTPVTGDCYYASNKNGAFKTTKQSTASKIQTRKKELDHAIVAGSRSHRGDSLKAFFEKLGSCEIVSMGSSLKSCLVAEGRVDIYPRLGPTSEWDTAAAQSIVEEAGGTFLDINMQPMRYNTKDSLLNPHFLVIGDPSFDWGKYLPK